MNTKGHIITDEQFAEYQELIELRDSNKKTLKINIFSNIYRGWDSYESQHFDEVETLNVEVGCNGSKILNDAYCKINELITRSDKASEKFSNDIIKNLHSIQITEHKAILKLAEAQGKLKEAQKVEHGGNPKTWVKM